jgi:hypothetical protein
MPADISRPGLLVAPDQDAWHKLRATLLADGG